MAGAWDALIEAEGLPAAYAAVVREVWTPLAAEIASLTSRRAVGGGVLVGVGGPQGTGKTTACLFLQALLEREHGLRAATLSLDDVYLPLAARREMAERLHPLFATRGPPGTHDVALARETIEALLRGRRPVRLPRFDKAADDRAARVAWPRVPAPVEVLLFEGWCVGARPQQPGELGPPANALERDEDPLGVWRATVNAQLAGPYRVLFERMDRLVLLRPSGFGRVAAWRSLQERKLRARTGGGGMDDAALARFLQHYERLTRAMLDAPTHADWIVDVDDAHHPHPPVRPDRPPLGD